MTEIRSVTEELKTARSWCQNKTYHCFLDRSHPSLKGFPTLMKISNVENPLISATCISKLSVCLFVFFNFTVLVYALCGYSVESPKEFQVCISRFMTQIWYFLTDEPVLTFESKNNLLLQFNRKREANMKTECTEAVEMLLLHSWLDPSTGNILSYNRCYFGQPACALSPFFPPFWLNDCCLCSSVSMTLSSISLGAYELTFVWSPLTSSTWVT